MDEEDALMVRIVALAAAVLVNLGRGVPPSQVIGEATEYEAHLTASATPEA